MTTDFTTQLPTVLVAGVFASLGASLLGNFVVLQRVSLAADVLSHVALPGIAVALALRIHPLFGAGAFLLIAALALWKLEKRTHLPYDTLVGILFSVTLAAGQLLFAGGSGEELLEALFGSLNRATTLDAIAAVAVGLTIACAIAVGYRPFVLSLVSPDLARVQGIKADRMKLIFLLLLALAVAAGIAVTGILFVGALLIFPAAISGNLSRGLRSALATSVASGVGSAVLGITIGASLSADPGAIIILILAALFAVSLPLRNRLLV